VDITWLEELTRLALGAYSAVEFGWDENELKRRFREDLDLKVMRIVSVDGCMAGAIAVEDHGEFLFLDYISLLPEYQRRGIGTALVQELLRQATEAGVSVRLNVLRSNPARRLYERLGFRTTGTDGHRWFMQWEK